MAILYNFGSGTLVGKPFGPNASGSPTPLEFGTLQDCSVEISASQKELYGKNQFPVAIARTASKLNIKAKFAEIQAKVLNDFFFGSTVGAGQDIGIVHEAHNAAATVTIAPPNSGTFKEDQGVRDSTSGLQMTKVTATPAAGVSYEVDEATGIYTFNASQGAMQITYIYHISGGLSSAVQNKAMGAQPVFEANLMNSQYGANFKMRFPNCISSKLTLGAKNEDFTIPEFDFSAFASVDGSIFSWDLDN